jgi:alpha-beta hydrolase superfamily lysophospholipase
MSAAKNENWLLLRGLVRGQGHWGSFLKDFQERFPHADIECLDLSGNGLENQKTSPLMIHEYMRDIRSRCRFVKEKKPFNVLALSLGAMIAVDWMHAFPHEIQKSFLVCTSSAGHSKFYERFQAKNLLVGFPILTAKTPEKWEEIVLKMIVNDPERARAEMPALVEFTRKYPVSKENVLRQLVAAARYRFPKRAPGDVTLIGTYGDRLVSPECTLQLAKAWGLEAIMHSTAGHDIPLDDPHWLLQQLA